MFTAALDQYVADDAADLHRNAYNAAFYQLGLSWYWDANTGDDLAVISGGRQRLQHYLETCQAHLLKVYEADFLIEAIQAAKARCHENMTACGTRVTRPVNWAEIQRGEVGV
jgi:hypothetical protein